MGAKARESRTYPAEAGPADRRAEEHEALCLKCGRCCHRKVLVGDRVIGFDSPCPHLDADTKLCRVYESRHEVNAECLSVPEGIRRGVFPADCPYVAGLAGYIPPLEDPDPGLVAELIAELEAEALDQDRSALSRLPARPAAGVSGEAGRRQGRRAVVTKEVEP